MSYTDFAQQEKAEFNYGISFLNRVNAIFWTMAEASSDLDMYSWFRQLLLLRRELKNYMTPEEFATSSQMREHLYGLVMQSNARSAQLKRNVIDWSLFSKLEVFEMFLRAVMKRSGLEMKMSDDPSRALK